MNHGCILRCRKTKPFFCLPWKDATETSRVLAHVIFLRLQLSILFVLFHKHGTVNRSQRQMAAHVRVAAWQAAACFAQLAYTRNRFIARGLIAATGPFSFKTHPKQKAASHSETRLSVLFMSLGFINKPAASIGEQSIKGYTYLAITHGLRSVVK